ncbi:MAG TPA: hypothetical protein DEA76_02760 [Erwinia persicina]|uniref:Uncharacterized protein n=1 Tax=Erwinia persicina TaxID=55211 RepID=A0A4U3F693_9GAMM|nr:hypothetical protein EpCFBP13511_15710 [Erwinia persicina]HBI06372.1 hypothetical protein [Erwinia persicina]HBT28693.1 hypothetical protein [Erwinia persicina]
MRHRFFRYEHVIAMLLSCRSLMTVLLPAAPRLKISRNDVIVLSHNLRITECGYPLSDFCRLADASEVI